MSKSTKDQNPPPVVLTPNASAQLKKALARERAADSGVRILLKNAGSGYRYDLEIEKKEKPGDHVSEQGGVTVYIDQFAAQYLQGTTLDWKETPRGSGFLFERPSQSSKS